MGDVGCVEVSDFLLHREEADDSDREIHEEAAVAAVVKATCCAQQV